MNQPLPPAGVMQTARASYEIGFMGPNDESVYKLGAGMYSLSSRSNVPYVTLVGAGGYNKTFSWGEIVEVPVNQSCAVKNASFHGGDVILNGGCDYDNRPAGICVPVTFEAVTILGNDYWRAPLIDTRMARRAFFEIDGNVDTIDGLELSVSVVGFRSDGSHFTMSEVDAASGSFLPAGTPGVGYVEYFILTAGESIGQIPLGRNSLLGTNPNPHALLTMAQVYFSPANNFRPEFIGPPGVYNCYYNLEY